MKQIKKGILILLTAFAAGLFHSCNFLNVDNYMLDTMNVDSIFRNAKNAKGFLWNTPTAFPDQGNFWGAGFTPGELASDEMTAYWRTAEFSGIQFTLQGDKINSSNLASFNIWSPMYKIIARCNFMLKNVDQVPDMDFLEKQEYKGYVHFIRGWAYYHLLQNFGPLYITGDEYVTTDATPESFNKPRETYHKSVDYICDELETAAKGMKEEIPSVEFGKPTRGAAFAIIARLRLQQASAMFNGGQAGRYFANWKRADGAQYISQTRNDTLWAKAAFACKRVIDMNRYSLHVTPITDEEKNNPTIEKLPATTKTDFPGDWPNGPGGINPYKSYKDIFDGEAVYRKNPEVIWAAEYSFGITSYEKHSFPTFFNGYGGMSVPQRVVDQFLMIDGNPINTPSATYPYTSTYTTKARNYWGYSLKSNNYGMYDNREMRFYANIGFSGREWTMYTSTKPEEVLQIVRYETPSDNGRKSKSNNINPDDYTVTGYVPVKYINVSDSYAEGGRVETKGFPIIRYAEILLGYVEALNELEGHSITISGLSANLTEVTQTFTRNEGEMKKYFNPIRFRVGLPGLLSIPPKTEMFEILQREYAVEFFAENRRYFDTRRWGIYINDDGKGLAAWSGMDMEATLRDDYYKEKGAKRLQTQNIRERQITAKKLWLPLPHNELLKVPAMDQNYGWER